MRGAWRAPRTNESESAIRFADDRRFADLRLQRHDPHSDDERRIFFERWRQRRVERRFEQWRRQCGRLRRFVLWFVGGLAGRRQSERGVQRLDHGAGRKPQRLRAVPGRQRLEHGHLLAPVDPNSTAIINFIGATVPVHPDFGSGLYNGSIIGIPYLVVGAQQGPVPIDFTAYGDESDPGPMPIPLSAEIEGYPNPGAATGTSS